MVLVFTLSPLKTVFFRVLIVCVFLNESYCKVKT
jgi:hypothetical protein